MVYQGLSHGLIESILLGINVRARFIKVSVHLEVQLSMSVSVKQLLFHSQPVLHYLWIPASLPKIVYFFWWPITDTDSKNRSEF